MRDVDDEDNLTCLVGRLFPNKALFASACDRKGADDEVVSRVFLWVPKCVCLLSPFPLAGVSTRYLRRCLAAAGHRAAGLGDGGGLDLDPRMAPRQRGEASQ